MKKKVLIIQSVILIAVTVLMLSAVSFAWFYNGRNPELEGFNVSVAGTASVSYEFFRKDSTDDVYNKIDPSTDKLIDDENMIPGVPVYCRVDISNNGGAAKVGMAINAITFTSSGEMSVEEKADLVDNFVLQRMAVSFEGGVAGVEPNEADIMLEENTVHFLGGTDGILFGIATGFELIRDIPLPPSDKVSIYYRFMLKMDFEGLNGKTFDITAKEARIYADLV